MKTNYLVIVLMSMGLVQLTAREQVSDEITENEPVLVSDISTEISEVTGFIDALPHREAECSRNKWIVFYARGGEVGAWCVFNTLRPMVFIAI